MVGTGSRKQTLRCIAGTVWIRSCAFWNQKPGNHFSFKTLQAETITANIKKPATRYGQIAPPFG